MMRMLGSGCLPGVGSPLTCGESWIVGPRPGPWAVGGLVSSGANAIALCATLLLDAGVLCGGPLHSGLGG